MGGLAALFPDCNGCPCLCLTGGFGKFCSNCGRFLSPSLANSRKLHRARPPRKTREVETKRMLAMLKPVIHHCFSPRSHSFYPNLSLSHSLSIEPLVCYQKASYIYILTLYITSSLMAVMHSLWVFLIAINGLVVGSSGQISWIFGNNVPSGVTDRVPMLLQKA